MSDDDLTEVVSAELRLLDPQVRSSPTEVGALLHSEFCEHSASGAVWDRVQILARLSAEPHLAGEAHDVRSVQLSRDVVLVTYRFDQGGQFVAAKFRLGTRRGSLADAVPPRHATSRIFRVTLDLRPPDHGGVRRGPP
jgi:hypothetical protein